MVRISYEVLICHQINNKFENQVDVNVKRLERKLEKEGFHVWTDKDPKRFQEGVERSKVVIACVSRQAQLSSVFNEKINFVIKSGKPVAVVTVEPDYTLPTEVAIQQAVTIPEEEPISQTQTDDPDDPEVEQNRGEAGEKKIPNMYPFLSQYHNFVLCGKTTARTNVYKLMDFIKDSVRDQDATKPMQPCVCWICQEISNKDDPDDSTRDIKWNSEDDRRQDDVAGEDEADGGGDEESKVEQKDSFFVSAAMSRLSTVLLADAKNQDIKVFDVEQGLISQSTVGEIRGIQHIVVLDSLFTLVSHKIKFLGKSVCWISILNEDLSDIKEWDTPEEVKYPDCLALLRTGEIAITSNSERASTYTSVYFVTEISPRVVKSFPLNMHKVTSLAASPYQDVIAASNWRSQEVRLFNYKGRQLWFLIWKDDLLLRAPCGLDFLSQDELLLCERDQSTVMSLDCKSGKIVKRLEDETNFVIKNPRLVAVSPPKAVPAFIMVTDNTSDPKFIKLQDS